MKFLITMQLLELQKCNTRTSDVQVLASHANDLLARKELLGHDGGKTTHGVSTAINHDFLFEHFYKDDEYGSYGTTALPFCKWYRSTSKWKKEPYLRR